MQIVLASGSPRRRQLLEMLGVEKLTVIPARGEERAPDWTTPGELVTALAAHKAQEVAVRCSEDELVIGADTVVCLDGEILGKPRSPEEAVEMLARLSGRSHRVYTGLALVHGGQTVTGFEESTVFFRHLERDEIQRYVDSGEPMDKAGAYGAQGLGALLVERIEGDFFNVMGLPLCRLGIMLKEQGVVIL